MNVIASAPGKLVVLGEYAVLFGAPAVVTAANARAYVRASVEPGPDSLLDAPALGLRDHAFRVEAGRVVHRRPLTDARLGLFDTVVAAAGRYLGRPPPPALLTLDTSAFFTQRGDKRGLGSSAALATALFAALVRLADPGARLEPSTVLRLAGAAHHAAQGGRGSGIDVAAACHGGTSLFQRRGELPEVTPLAFPDELHLRALFVGAAQETRAFIAAVERLADSDRGRFDGVMQGLRQQAEAGAQAFARRDLAGVLAAVRAYYAGLARLGAAAGIDIVSAAHRRLHERAVALGAAYKPSGAGGGDLGLAFAADSAVASRLDAALRQIEQVEQVDIAPGAPGLIVEVS